jgi:hypothetical protein
MLFFVGMTLLFAHAYTVGVACGRTRIDEMGDDRLVAR